MRDQFAIGAVVLAAVSLCACSPGTERSAASAEGGTAVPGLPVQPLGDVTFAANGTTVTVRALDNNFIEQSLTVEAGTEVVWENTGRNDHDVTPVDDPSATTWGVKSEAFAPKATYSHVFDQPGTYAYFCTIHGTAKAGMIGTIVVTSP